MLDENLPKVDNNSEINDIRPGPSFKSISFSKYKKTEVRKQLIENMKNAKLEQSVYWAAELICAGHFMEVWEIILHYTGKHIHLGNPKIVIYLQMRFEIFKNIVAQGQFLNELQLRNHPTIRKLFAEIISTLSLSNRKHSFEPIKINKDEEFDMTQMTERLKATSMHYAEDVFKKDDPRELFIAINEFSYNISQDVKSTITACYWVEWIIEFDAICKKRKQPCFCERRSKMAVEKKFQRDIIWILWDSLFENCEKMNNPYITKLMTAILDIFSIKYTTASSKKRRYLLYFAVALLTETVPTNIELMSNKPVIQNVVDKINEVYKQIKKQEESPNTDYLFANLQRENTFEKSMKKMDLVNSLDIFSK
uniref:Uncharacterized protein n=1 Tax=viral metagenome TaxID=1070528 RepID=A0A6C0JDT8_9ZZZZ